MHRPGLTDLCRRYGSASHASSSGGGGYAPSWRGQRDVGIFESATYRAQRARPPQASSIQGLGSFALVQPAAVIRGSPLAPPHYAAAVSTVIAAAMPAPVEGALQCALHIDECYDWFVVIITCLTVVIIMFITGVVIGKNRGGNRYAPPKQHVRYDCPDIQYEGTRVTFGRDKGLTYTALYQTAHRDYIVWPHTSAFTDYSSASIR